MQIKYIINVTVVDVIIRIQFPSWLNFVGVINEDEATVELVSE